MPSNPDLWARLDSYSLDDPDVRLGFTARLARENGWRRAHAARVVAEYRRFVYLTQVADGTMTPSDAVDQAWHLHLTYTRDYWDRLCGEVLGRQLHHGPTRGGATEDATFRRCYQETRALYRAEFGHPPPADIWPEPDIRFGEASAYRRINTARAWVLPRLRWPRPVATVLRAVAAGLVLLVGGGSLALAQEADGLDEDALIVFGIVIALAIGVSVQIARSGQRRQRRGDRHDSSAGCGGGGGDGSSGCGGSGCGGD